MIHAPCRFEGLAGLERASLKISTELFSPLLLDSVAFRSALAIIDQDFLPSRDCLSGRSSGILRGGGRIVLCGFRPEIGDFWQ